MISVNLLFRLITRGCLYLDMDCTWRHAEHDLLVLIDEQHEWGHGPSFRRYVMLS